MRWLILTAALGTLIVGCENAAIDDFRTALPDANALKLAVPETGTSGSKVALTPEAVVAGDTSQGQAFTYGLTRLVTSTVNGEVGLVLGVLAAVAATPPASFDGSVATWGPYSEPLSANTYRLVATKTGADSVEYHVDGKRKGADNSAYVTLLTGSHTGHTKGLGEGAFELDCDAFQILPEHFDQVGKVEVTYSRPTVQSATQIEVAVKQVFDAFNHEKRVDGVYHYVSTPGQGGSFDFAVSANIHWDAQHPAFEDLSIRSRWTEDGAGRADTRVTGGDLGGQALLNECWSTSFASRYLNLELSNTVGGQFAIGYGVEATDCAFPTADYAP